MKLALGMARMVDRQTVSFHPPDGQLLLQFVRQKDQASFAELMRRHQQLVWNTCRRWLGYHDAEDAFQATFLILARKASTVEPPNRVAAWLHGVAFHVSRKLMIMKSKRTRKEADSHRKMEAVMLEPSIEAADWKPILDQELKLLPEIYRLPLLLCDLENQDRRQTARQLGWKLGTLSGRLHRARKILAKRLKAKGITLGSASLFAVVSQAEAVTFDTSREVLTHVAKLLDGATPSQILPAPLLTLMEGTMNVLTVSRWKLLSFGLAIAGTIGLSASLFAQEKKSEETKPQPTPVLPAVFPPATKFKVKLHPLAELPHFIAQIKIHQQEKVGDDKKVNPTETIMAPRVSMMEGQTATVQTGNQLPLGTLEELVHLGLDLKLKVNRLKDDKLKTDFTFEWTKRTSEKDQVEIKVPILGDLPVLGSLFRNQKPEVPETETETYEFETIKKRVIRIIKNDETISIEQKLPGEKKIVIELNIREAKPEDKTK